MKRLEIVEAEAVEMNSTVVAGGSAQAGLFAAAVRQDGVVRFQRYSG